MTTESATKSAAEVRLKKQFSFSKDAKGNEIVQLKTSSDYPYRIRVVPYDLGDTSIYRLEKSSSPHKSVKPVFNKIKDFHTREGALLYICDRHNRVAKQVPELGYTLV